VANAQTSWTRTGWHPTSRQTNRSYLLRYAINKHGAHNNWQA